MIDVDYAPLSKSLLKPLMPLVPLLEELKEMALHVGLATNDSHYSAHSHLSHLGILELFDDVIAADTVPTPKPSGDMIRRFAGTVGLKPSEIAMVGDNGHDMEEARNGGLPTMRFSPQCRHGDIALGDHPLPALPSCGPSCPLMFYALSECHGFEVIPQALVARHIASFTL